MKWCVTMTDILAFIIEYYQNIGNLFAKSVFKIYNFRRGI